MASTGIVSRVVIEAAIGYVVKARGMTQIAKDSGMGRENLYKAFAPGAKPRFDTVLKVTHALGIDLCAQLGHAANHSIL
ncbi:addiction module antidote protein [Pseudomonas sp. B21-048]|uniref:addiction module antidote protein n=1 Tax=Pseudomonas sp. B21-048 TaxID=2895490 RepID=UPI0038D4845C